MQLFKSTPLSTKESVHISQHQHSVLVHSGSSKHKAPQDKNNTKRHHAYRGKITAVSITSRPAISEKQMVHVPEAGRTSLLAKVHQGRPVLHQVKPTPHQVEVPVPPIEGSVPQAIPQASNDNTTVLVLPEIAPLTNDVQVKTNSTSKNPVYPAPGILPIEKEKWVQTFGFFTGMSGIRSSIVIYDEPGNSALPPPGNIEKYASIRNAQERSTSSIDLSLRTSWMKHHFLIQTGVDYFEWGEQLQYDYNIVFDGINRYSYVSLPLYLGYHQSWKKVGLSASVGSSIGGVIKRDGLYIHPNLTTMTTEQASVWTTTGYFQLELSYLLDNYRFSIAPTYRKSLSTVIFSGYAVNKYDSFGLQMGISVILK
jgi:hypothetical protein